MKIQSINKVNYCNRNYNIIGKNVDFKGYVYKPNKNCSFNNFNPVMLYVNKLFERSLIASRRRIQSVSQNLALYTKEINIGKSYGWDITKGDRKKYIIILHGTGQNITNLQTLYENILTKTNYAVLAPEYRGFGKNEPAIISAKTLTQDTQAALNYLTKEKKIPPENISVLGHSFGGFAASQLVSANPKLERLILVSSIDSLKHESVNFDKGARRKIPEFIKFLFNHIALMRKPLANIFKTNDCLKNISVPVNIIHSQNDTLVKVSSAANLAAKCKNLQGLHILKTGGHGMDSTKIDTIISVIK